MRYALACAIAMLTGCCPPDEATTTDAGVAHDCLYISPNYIDVRPAPGPCTDAGPYLRVCPGRMVEEVSCR